MRDVLRLVRGSLACVIEAYSVGQTYQTLVSSAPAG